MKKIVYAESGGIMIKACKCGGELLAVKVRVTGLAELHIGIDGADLGMETDTLKYAPQATVYCAACEKRRKDLRYDKLKGLEVVEL